jgi:hypothetical protein
MNPKKRGSTFTGRCALILLTSTQLLVCAQTAAQPQQAAPAFVESDTSPRLTTIKRVCVDKFAGEESLVATVQEIAIASIFSLKRFTVTEKCDKADAVLKGAVIERVENKIRAEGEATNFGVSRGAANVNRHSGTAAFGAALGGSGESLMSAETGSHASVTLRLTSADGDVLWAYTQDSPGGKTRGAVSDAVDRAIRQLQREIERAAAQTK